MRRVMILVALLIGLGSPCRADDGEAARKVIAAQVEALSRDDGAAAYSFAAPAIQLMFRDPDSFMAMVRQGYGAIYRHKSFAFGDFAAVDGRLEQKARVIDADGVPWDALYTLETQPDGSLKIIGCLLLKVGEGV